MLEPFFRAAMIAPSRQTAFRKLAAVHLLFLGLLAAAWHNSDSMQTRIWGAYCLIGAAITEGAVLIGWRLVQMPKNQSLEFLLSSPVQPHRVFVAEALVGISRMVYVHLAGLPILGLLLFTGDVEPVDLLVLTIVPLTYGIVAGLTLTVWAYETMWVRRVGQILSGLGILVYLVVGVMAGERIGFWLGSLPEEVAGPLMSVFMALHDLNPFGLFNYWLNPYRVGWVALERATIVEAIGLVAATLLFARGTFRLKGHFHDRHYKPISSSRAAQTEKIGNRPLSWWAVRRVMEYSGRVNIWLAGGFGIVYSAYIVAGDHWPSWMGVMVFQIFERMGGAPALITGMVLLAAVPAAFQYGLWDASKQDRCRRLELLLLTQLESRDYWHAAITAAWVRGRGYFVTASILWVALLISGRATGEMVFASVAASMLLWCLTFVVGFRAFSGGSQANSVGPLLTLGMPAIAFIGLRFDVVWLTAMTPPGAVYLALMGPLAAVWYIGPLSMALLTLWIGRKSLGLCDRELRVWMDANYGSRMLE